MKLAKPAKNETKQKPCVQNTQKKKALYFHGILFGMIFKNKKVANIY